MPRDSAPTILPVPISIPQDQRSFLESIANALRLRLGQTANELDRSPTLREILSGDFGEINVNVIGGGTGGGGGTPAPYDPFTDTTPPPVPSGLTAAAAGPWAILLNWNNPPNPNPGSPPYIAFTEVYANSIDDLNTAVLIGIGYSSFTHTVEPGETWYYWIRFLNYAGIAGAFHPTVNGVSATSGLDAASTLLLLTNEITESQLFSTLNSRIDLIDVTTILGQTGLVGGITYLDGELGTTNTAVGVLEAAVNDPSTGLATRASQTEVTQLDVRADALDGGTASGVSIAQLEAGVNTAIQDSGSAVITADAAVQSVAVVDARVDVVDGGVFASATNIDQITAAVSAPGLANELTGNPNFRREDLLSPGRPIGPKATYGSNDPGILSYADPGKTRLRLYSPSDTSIGMCWPAMKVTEGERYRIKMRYRMITGITGITGMYIRAIEKTSTIASEKTHIGWAVGESGVDFGTTSPYVNTTTTILSGTDTGNGNAPGNNIGSTMENRSVSALSTWYEVEVLYEPSANAEWASPLFLNWDGVGTADFEFEYVYVYQDVAELRSTVEVLATTTAGPNGNLAQYTIKVDANGNIAGFGLSSEINEEGVGTTQAIFNVDRFAIIKADGTGGAKVPFVVDSGIVVIDGALIKTASITNASIDTLNGNKIIANSVSAQKLMVDGISISRSGDYLIIPNAAIKNAMIDDAEITAAKIGDAEVDTLRIAGNAVTVPWAAIADFAGGLTLINNVPTVLVGNTGPYFNISATAGASPVLVTWALECKGRENDSIRVRILDQWAQGADTYIFETNSNIVAQDLFPAGVFISTLGVGDHRLQIEFTIINSGNLLTWMYKASVTAVVAQR